MQIKTQNLKTVWQIGLLVMLCAVIIMIPDFAYAAYSVDQAICLVANVFSGNAGRGIATIGMCVLGASACFGRVDWIKAMVIGIGVSLMFGAVAMITLLGGAACATA